MTNFLITMGGRQVGKNRHNEIGIKDRDYTAEAKRLFESAKPRGFKCEMYDNKRLDSSHYFMSHNDVMSQPSWGWAFKPICIYDGLLQLQEEDILLWVDSNHIIAQDPAPILEIIKDTGSFIHDHWRMRYPNSQWTHKDTFVMMNCNEPRYWDAPQMQVNILGFAKCAGALNFVGEWLSYCLDYDTNITRGQFPDMPGFQDSRYEQSILSILVEKYNVPYIHRDDNPELEQIIPELEGMEAKNG